MPRKHLLLAAVVLIFIPINGLCAELVTDRPDFTESSETVPRFFLQSELGVDYSTIGDAEDLTVPNWLIRFGLLRFLELRLGVPSYVGSFQGSSTVHGVTGLELGMKTTFGLGRILRFGFLPYMVVPVREQDVNNGNFEAGARFTWSLALGHIVSLSGNLGVFGQGLAAPLDPTPGYLASISLGIGLTRRLGIFAELYTISEGGEHFRPVADGGLTFLVTPRFQLDAYLGIGLNENTYGVNPGAGMSWMF